MLNHSCEFKTYNNEAVKWIKEKKNGPSEKNVLRTTYDKHVYNSYHHHNYYIYYYLRVERFPCISQKHSTIIVKFLLPTVLIGHSVPSIMKFTKSKGWPTIYVEVRHVHITIQFSEYLIDWDKY